MKDLRESLELTEKNLNKVEDELVEAQQKDNYIEETEALIRRRSVLLGEHKALRNAGKLLEEILVEFAMSENEYLAKGGAEAKVKFFLENR